jgi:hypothetical protein
VYLYTILDVYSILEDYKYYKREVYNLTQISYKKFINMINPLNYKRNFNWQLDHKYSVSQGFIDKIEPKIISSPYNLQMLTMKQNYSKNYKCSITKEDLLEEYEQDALQTRNI